MIVFSKLTEDGFSYEFRKGVSTHDIDCLIKEVQSFCKKPLPQSTINHIKRTEYFPSTKNFKNLYSWKFLSNEQFVDLEKK